MSEQVPTSPLSPATSPLLEADPNSINELIKERIDEIMNIPPLAKDAEGNYLLTDDKLRLQVRYYQQERLRFLKESQEKESRPRAKRQPRAVAAEEAKVALRDLL